MRHCTLHRSFTRATALFVALASGPSACSGGSGGSPSSATSVHDGGAASSSGASSGGGTGSSSGSTGGSSQGSADAGTLSDGGSGPGSADGSGSTDAGAMATPPPQAAGYTLAFSGDFNPFDLSPNGTGDYTWYNPGIPWESPAPYSNITVASSILTLNWKQGQGTDDTSISTSATDASHYRAWRYGYFEASFRWDPVTGSWPAFWMIPVQGIQGASETGEFDIMEGQGVDANVYYGTIHDWQGSQDVASNGNSNTIALPNGTDVTQYHKYGLLWVPGKVTWYFDDEAMNSASTYSIMDQQDYFVIVGSQEGADWQYGDMAGVTATSIPLDVEWVRVWQP